MIKLFIKDLRLAINPIFFFLPILFGALFLIPQWPYFIVFMYFFFISVPNIFGVFNAQNDLGLSIMMPVSKKEIVRGRFLSIGFIELLYLIWGGVFAVIHNLIYGRESFLFDPNPALFGFAFLMFAVFNLCFFPMYYRTAYRYGIPTIIGVVVTIIYAAAVEFWVLFSPGARAVFEGNSPEMRLAQWGVLAAGILLSVILHIPVLKLAERRFERVDV